MAEIEPPAVFEVSREVTDEAGPCFVAEIKHHVAAENQIIGAGTYERHRIEEIVPPEVADRCA